MTEANTNVAGIDIGKRRLAVASWPATAVFEVDNDEAGHASIVERLRAAGVVRVGIEASGGYERRPAAALRAAGFTVVMLQPAQVRAYARFRLRHAKNDKLDAALIARCTAEIEAPPTSVDPACERLAEQIAFYEQLTEDLARLKTRRERFSEPDLLALLDAQIAAKGEERALALTRMRALLRGEEPLLGRVRRIESVPGIGFLNAVSLAVRMPELGSIDRRRIASLAGVAPFDQDSGGHHGERHVFGGRDRVRRLLYMAALSAARCNPTISALYRRLVAVGKAHKVALTACMRKLLAILTAMLRDGRDWDCNPA